MRAAIVGIVMQAMSTGARLSSFGEDIGVTEEAMTCMLLQGCQRLWVGTVQLIEK